MFKNILIFTIGTVFNKGINFFILPILTYYLSKDDYGMIGVINSILTISIIYIGFYPNNFIMVKFFKYGKEEISRYIFNIFILIFLSFFIVLFLLIIFSNYLIPHYENSKIIVIFITFLALFQVLWRMWSVLIEIKRDALRYVIAQFIQTSLTIGLTLFLIIKLSYGWEGKFFAEFSLYFISSIYVIYYLYKYNYIKVNFDLKKIKEIFLFLFPLTFYVVGLFAMGTIDKIFVANMLDLKSAGIYSIAITLSIILNILFESILKAWLPTMFELLNEKEKDAYKKVIKGNYLYSIFVVVSVILYIFISPFIFDIMIDDKFSLALHFLPILIIAYGFEGLRKPITELLNHIDKVNIVAYITIFSSFLNIILNIFLIKEYGIKGAAYATLISFALLYLLTLFFVFYYYKVDKKYEIIL